VNHLNQVVARTPSDRTVDPMEHESHWPIEQKVCHEEFSGTVNIERA